MVVAPLGLGKILTNSLGVQVDRRYVNPAKAVSECGSGPPIILGTKLLAHHMALELVVLMDRFVGPAFDLRADMAVERQNDEQVVVNAFLLVGFQHPDILDTTLAEGIQEAIEMAMGLSGAVHSGREGESHECDESQGVTEEEVVHGGPQKVEELLDVLRDKCRLEGDEPIPFGR
jgi:hypothetical protein